MKNVVQGAVIINESEEAAQFVAFLQLCSDQQIQSIYEREWHAGRGTNIDLVVLEAARRKMELIRMVRPV